MSKIILLRELNKIYSECFKGQEIVLGDGNTDAAVLLIGEAPGKDEVKLKKPFVGAAGKNLSEFLNALGLSREDIYITNAIKYRLSKENAKTGRFVNRPAQAKEIEINRKYLIDEIKIINPKFIVTLGNVPLKAITSDITATIGSVHGSSLAIKLEDSEYTLFPLYHPASIIYNRSLKDIYQKDIEILKKVIL